MIGIVITMLMNFYIKVYVSLKETHVSQKLIILVIHSKTARHRDYCLVLK